LKPASNSFALLLPVLAVIGSIVSLCVGSSFAKKLFSTIGPQGATSLRVSFAAIILLLIWRPWRLAMSRREAKEIVLYGVTLGLMNLLFYMAISKLPLGIAIAIEFVGPLALAMYSSRKLIDFVWIGFAVLGLALLLPFRQGANSLDLIGVCYALGAAVCWALYIIFGKRAGRGHAGQVTSLGLMIAAFVVLPFGVVRAGAELLNPALITTGLAVGVMSSAIPYSLEMFALKRLPKQTFGILLSMEPAVGALAAFFVLGETLTILQWFAVGSIIIASVGCTIGISGDDAPLADADGVAPV
jgi:inner membrane transporter RhtA